MECTFCGEEIAPSMGLMYVKKDAKVFYFCSRKCEKNMLQLKRKPRNIAWTAEARKAKEVAKAAGAKSTGAKTAKKPKRK